MTVLIVALCGAVIGTAFNLLTFMWEHIRFFSYWLNVRPASVLVHGAIGGALVISIEFWSITGLWLLLT